MPQRLLSRLRARCAADERLASAMLYGSFAHGEADAWSDLDVVLFFDDDRRAEVDPREWLEGVAPLRLLSVNEFGNHAAIFEGLVRGEFHFEREGDVEQLLAWGRDLFPSIASTVLLDRSGRLTGVVAQLVGTPAPAAYRRLVPQLGLDLATWGLLAVQVLERGEHVRAAELVGGLLHRDLLRLVRLREGVDPRWRQPRRRLERELSTKARERFLRTCVPGPSVPATRVALAATLGWAMELLAVLDGGGEHEYDGVLEELVRRLEAPKITIDARGPRATPRAPYAPGVAGGDGPRMDEQSVADFGELFRRFLASVVETAPRGEAFFRDLLARHLGTEPEALPVTTQEFGSWEHGSLQRALDAYAAAPERTCELVGLLAGERYGGTAALTDLISDRGGKGGLRPGPVAYVNRQVAPGESLACIALGLLLVHDASGPLAVLVRQAPSPAGQPTLLLELMAPAEAAKSAFLGELRDLMHRHNVFRGRVVSFSGGGFMEESNVTFHERTDLPRDRIVLPDGVLERVERHVLGIAEHRARLLAAGRELKRGVLLHGPPGTGKTLTVTYLVGAMAEATVVVLVGAGLGMVGAACAIARSLQPSLVILEDVDLIAEVRTFPGGGGSLLFQLLNEMDGMAGDADVAFLLTTNRPDLLEPALAARPGRVDQAVEIPLPDADGRRRLLALYADGLGLPTDGLDDAVARTEGVSASFIKELLRQAALHAAERSPEALVVTTDDLSRTLDTLLDERAALTRVLLGGAPPRQRGGRDGFEDDDWPPGMPPPFMLDD